MDELKPYTVTTQDLETTESVQSDLTTSQSTPATIPDRQVEIANERPLNERNTVYFLTDAEAQALKDDPRVQDVFDVTQLKPGKFALQNGNFNKTATASGSVDNWGLLRHINPTNVFGTSTTDPGGTYDYVLDGTGVDVVIVDSGIQADHPEFQDANGVSRVKQINWYTASGVAGTMPAGFYTDYDGHGTHVAGTIAGKTFGWAKNADIYSIKLGGLEGLADPNSGMSVTDVMDVILGWHNAKTNGRPTVVNNSWGYLLYWRTADSAIGFQPSGGSVFAISGGSYRGTGWSGSAKDTSKGHTGAQVDTNVWAFPLRVTSVDADIAQLINAGVIVCNSAGNFSTKDEVAGGNDHNNYVNLISYGTYYYHRGSSPHCDGLDGLQVGSLSVSTTGGLEKRSTFSNTGSGVDVYASGENVISAYSNVNAESATTAYALNASFYQEKLNGTSMASPQIAGMAALLKQVYPNWTPAQVKNWIVKNAKSVLAITGSDNDYTDSTSLLGGGNKLAYFPMNGQKYYQITAV